ncbi:hypothetical protein D3C80_683840 [compost metagenome]
MHHQRRHVELLQVFGEVGFRERLDAVIGVLVAGHHALHPEPVDHALGRFRVRLVEAEERAAGEVDVQLRTVGQRGLADAVEHFQRQAAGVGFGLEHQRWHRGNQPGLGHAAGAVATDVTRHLATAGGEAEQHGVLQVEQLDQLRQIVGVMVHVIARPRLAGTPMTATVVGDDPIPVGGQENHLRFPTVGVQRPAVTEDNRLTGAPVLVVNLDAVAGSESAHG